MKFSDRIEWERKYLRWCETFRAKDCLSTAISWMLVTEEGKLCAMEICDELNVLKAECRGE